MNIPSELHYTSSHEWARLESDGTVSVGITDHAQEVLGDLVYIQLPKLKQLVKATGECAVVESVKAAADVYAPVTGEVIAINDQLADHPDLVNQGAYDAWLFKIKPEDVSQLGSLLDAPAYQASIDSGH